MSFLVDTSVWSLALRRDRPAPTREVELLREWLEQGEEIVLLGVVLQEVLQGFADAARTRRLVRALAPFPLLALGRDDYLFAAELRNGCRARGVQIGTVDAQIAAASVRHRCPLLTGDADFRAVADHYPLQLA